MEPKKLNWINQVTKKCMKEYNYPEYFIMIFAHIPVFGRNVYIQNWKSYKKIGRKGTTIPAVEKDVFYFYYQNDYGDYSHKVKCKTLEEAKKMAQDYFAKMIKEKFFEPSIVRKVLVEKSKKKIRKKKFS